MEYSSKIYLAGHTGLVGSTIFRKLQSEGYSNIITRELEELDLRNQAAVNEFFASEKPEYVFLAAAKVGGILANNTYPAEFIADNAMIEINIIDAAWKNGVKKLEFLGSSCIYPKMSPQPIKEEYLLTGSLEPTNEWYALAKILGIKMCQAYTRQYGFKAISLMPTNLYGPRDNFDLNSSHVLPAMIRKMHDAKISESPTVTIWGTGSPKREFLYVEDLADAAVFLMNNYDGEEIVNVGTGEDIAIKDLAAMVKDVVGFQGELVYDTSKPDGTPRKLLDVSKINGLGWKAGIELKVGIEQTYKWYLQSCHNSSK